MAALHIYDATEVTASFSGVLMQGFGDGEFVKIEMTSDAFTSVVGTDGEVTRSKSSDGRAKITVTLMQSSETNDKLSALYNLDRSTPGGAGVGVFYVRDRGGRSLYVAPQAWIMKAPDVTFDREPTPREWVFECASLQRVDGGN